MGSTKRATTKLREHVRGLLIDAHVGLISAAQLTARADDLIRQRDNLPDYLIALSLGEPLAHIPRLDLVREPIDTDDLVLLACRLLNALEAGALDLDGLGAIATRLTYLRSDAAIEPAWARVAWIVDELELVDTGIKDAHGLHARVARVLKELCDQSLTSLAISSRL